MFAFATATAPKPSLYTSCIAPLVSESALGAIASPGDEVLILAPFWPLIRGIVQAFGATPVEVPFYDRVNDREGAIEAVSEVFAAELGADGDAIQHSERDGRTWWQVDTGGPIIHATNIDTAS